MAYLSGQYLFQQRFLGLYRYPSFLRYIGQLSQYLVRHTYLYSRHGNSEIIGKQITNCKFLVKHPLTVYLDLWCVKVSTN